MFDMDQCKYGRLYFQNRMYSFSEVSVFAVNCKIPGYAYLVYTDLNIISGPTKFDANPITNKKATVV